MCGITGIINLSGQNFNLSGLLRDMTKTIRHRGPDGEGYLLVNDSERVPAFSEETPENVRQAFLSYSPKLSVSELGDQKFQFGFGHRRLSVIDVSAAGHQPMCDNKKQVWITFNGEIYNYVELKETLQLKGVNFYTHTDTEVILQAYLFWGQDCVEHFNGMWSFVIYDSNRNILFGSRDRVGVKPFYYYMDKDVFVFASEQKALAQCPLVQTGINFAEASRFLAGDIYFKEQGEENLFSNIFELLPGYNFEFGLSTNTFHKWKYYSLNINTEFVEFNKARFNEYRDKTESLLINSIKLRLRSDVPVGSCLSGGLDSSAIVCLIDHLAKGGNYANFGEKLNVFTLKFEDQAIDESKWAKHVVDQTDAEWNLVSPGPEDMFKDFRALNYAQDIPVCSTGTYAQFRLMRATRDKGIKVVLDGQGGDELFGGYFIHHFIYWKELLRRGKFSKFYSELLGYDKPGLGANRIVTDFAKSIFLPFVSDSTQVRLLQRHAIQNEFLNKNVIRQYISSGDFKSDQAESSSNSLNEVLLRDFMEGRLKMFLKYEDRSSMWHSVESRTPFADDVELTNYVFSIPGAYKIRSGRNKYLFREAVRKYLPQPVADRKDKLGLVTPIDDWMKQLRNRTLEVIDNSVKDYIDVKGIKKKPDRFFKISNHEDGVRVFRMLSFTIWKDVFKL